MKYAPFSSLIELPFYYSLASHKIDHDKLDESPRTVVGQYVPHDGGRMQVHGSALTADSYVLPSSITTRNPPPCFVWFIVVFFSLFG